MKQQRQQNKQKLQNYSIKGYFVAVILVMIFTPLKADYSLIQSLNPLQSYQVDYLVPRKTSLGVNQTIKFVLPEIDSTFSSSTSFKMFRIEGNLAYNIAKLIESGTPLSKTQFYEQPLRQEITQSTISNEIFQQETENLSGRKIEYIKILVKRGKQTDSFSKAIEEINNQTGQKLSVLEQQPISCQLINPSVQMFKVYNSLQESSFNIYHYQGSSVSQQKTYLLVPIKALLYSFDPQTSTIQAYHYTQKQIKLLSSYRAQIKVTMPFTVSMVAHPNGDHVYIFTEKGIIWIDTQTILTNIKYIKSIGSFRPGIKLQKDSILVGMSPYFGVFVFKDEPVFFQTQNQMGQFLATTNFTQVSNQLNQLGFKKWNEIQFLARDIYFEGGQLYCFEFALWCLVPELSLRAEHKIDFVTQENGNFRLIVEEQSIFILFNQRDAAKMVQIYHNKKEKRGQLVRYYKTNQFIKEMKLFEAESTKLSNGQTKQKFLFMIADDDFLEVYPFNKDPRMISSLDNGAKLQVNKIRSIFHIFGDRFIIITDDDIKYVRLRINKPKISCSTNPQTYKGPGDYLLRLTNNVSSCQKFSQTVKFAHKSAYNSYCQLKQYHLVNINDPDYNQFKKYQTYGIVLAFVLVFLVGLMILIQWRNNKLLVLQRLKDQIVRFRNRAKRMQPYVQQQQKSQDVEVEVPKLASLRDQQDLQQPNNYNLHLKNQVQIEMPNLNHSK